MTRVAQRVSTRATMLKPRVNTSGHRLYPVTRLDPRRVNSRARGDDHGRIMFARSSLFVKTKSFFYKTHSTSVSLPSFTVSIPCFEEP